MKSGFTATRIEAGEKSCGRGFILTMPMKPICLLEYPKLCSLLVFPSKSLCMFPFL